MTKLHLWIVSVLFILLSEITGCTPAPSSEAADGYTARIIIKFFDSRANPADSQFTETLSRDAGVTLVYLRPMSGAAHVFEVRGLRDAAELQEVVRRLSKQPSVVYAEEDRMRRPQ